MRPVTRALIVLLAIDALLVAYTIVLAQRAQHNPEQDAAGRGMVWLIPMFLGALLAVALFFWLVRLPKVALVVAVISTVMGLRSAMGTVARSRAETRFVTGRSVFAGEDSQDLARAIASYNVPKIRKMVGAGAKLDVASTDGYETLLTWTIGNHRTMAPLLLELGANPNFTADKGLGPIIEAVGKGLTEIVRMLLDKGADPNTTEMTVPNPVLFKSLNAPDTSIFYMLVDRGADLHAVQYDSASILMAIAAAGRWSTASFLLDRGLDPRHVADEGRTLKTILDTQQIYEPQLNDPAYKALIAALRQRGILVERDQKD